MANTLEIYREKQSTGAEEMLRRNVLDILRCYRNYWDPYGELLQNSVDAINRRYRMFNDSSFYLYSNSPDRDYSDFEGYILIEVSPSRRTIRISDNGVGIDKDKLGELILPDCSDKKRGCEYGYKGKGLTYAAYSSESFTIKSKKIFCPDAYELSLDGMLDWVCSEAVSYPNGPIPDASPCYDLPDNISTSVEITLADSYKTKFSALSSLDNTFDLIAEEDYYDTFINLLQTKTAVGNTKHLFNEKPCVEIKIELCVLDDSNNVIARKNVPYRFAHPKDNALIKSSSYNFEEYVLRQASHPGSTTSTFCLTHCAKDITIGDHSSFKISACLSAVFKVTLTHINTMNLKYSDELIAQYSGYQPGVYLSIDGMPTGIRIDNWEKSGAENKRYYAIVDCALGIGDELDAGRKGISGYRADQITQAVNELKKTRIPITINGETTENKFSTTVANNLQQITTLGGYAGDDLTDYEVRLNNAFAVIEREKTENSELYQILCQYSSLLHFPNTEEEVRTLFHELLAQNIIVGYSTIFDAANRATYDSALSYNLPIESRYSQQENRNGIRNEIYSYLESRRVNNLIIRNLKTTKLNSDRSAICVEYKSSLDGLLGDVLLKNSSKNKDEMGLVICWDYDNISSIYDDTYTLMEINNGDELFGVTHMITLTDDTPVTLKCICLKKFLEKMVV